MLYFKNFIVFLTLLTSVRLDDPTPHPIKAKGRVSWGEHRFFTGKDVEMTCSVPDDPLAEWTYKWLKDNKIVGSSQVYQIKNARFLQSGKYTCIAQKPIEEWPYTVNATASDPLGIHVDGGWVILRTSYEPLLIEETTTLTCLTRDDAFLDDAIFYKGEVEIQKQKNSELVLNNLTLEDNGMYSCRATWLMNQEYQSSRSVPSPLIVLDKLETPRLVFPSGKRLARIGTKVEFNCITKVNAKEADLNLEYFYLKDGERLGPASTKDTFTIRYVNKDDSGVYTCKVRIRSLNLERWSAGLSLKVY